MASQYGQENLIRSRGILFGSGLAPEDVKIVGVGGTLAVFEYVHPPWVIGAGRHMIRHNIQQKPHSIVFEALDHLLEFLLGSELGVDQEWVGDVITMRAAAPSLKTRRSVKIGDAKLVQIRNQFTGVCKTKSDMKLDPVR